MQPTNIVSHALGNETDRYALLMFKESILDDPHGVLSSCDVEEMALSYLKACEGF